MVGRGGCGRPKRATRRGVEAHDAHRGEGERDSMEQGTRRKRDAAAPKMRGSWKETKDAEGGRGLGRVDASEAGGAVSIDGKTCVRCMEITHLSFPLGTERCKLWAVEETTNEAFFERAPDWKMREPNHVGSAAIYPNHACDCPCAMLGKSERRASEEESARTNRFAREGWEQFIYLDPLRKAIQALCH